MKTKNGPTMTSLEFWYLNAILDASADRLQHELRGLGSFVFLVKKPHYNIMEGIVK